MKILMALLLVTQFAAVGCSHHGRHKHAMKHWEMMDADKDGAVSRAEYEKAHAEKFNAMDANKDGHVTKDEKKAYFKSKKHRK